VHVQHGLFKFNCLENTTPGTLDHRKQNSPSKQTCEQVYSQLWCQ